MKKSLLFAVALIMGVASASAQIGESKSKKIETKYTTTTVSVPVKEQLPNANYNRLLFGFASTAFVADGDSERAHGLNLAWLHGFNLTQGKKLPLYLEAGLGATAVFGEVLSSTDKMLSFEIPVNVTYRYNIPNTNVRLSPYMGLHLKVNALAMDDDGDSYFDYDGANRCQVGMQLGVNFDFNRFTVGFGWSKDFMSFMEIDAYYDEYQVSTNTINLNLGVVF